MEDTWELMEDNGEKPERKARIKKKRLLARLMAHAVTARRALWLRHWTADAAPKLALCNILYNGKMLFRKTLEEAINDGQKSVGISSLNL